MLILTNENKAFDVDHIPDQEDNLRYCVLDCADPHNIDFYWKPLVFLQSFNAPAAVLEIGPYKVQMPLDWSVLVCDSAYSDMEVMPLTSLNDRGFYTITFNPLRHMVPVPHEVSIANIYADVKFYVPQLKNGSILVVPMELKNEPVCALFVKEGSKIPDPIDMAVLFDG